MFSTGKSCSRYFYSYANFPGEVVYDGSGNNTVFTVIRLDRIQEINSKSKDLKNYPKGVWTLPPSLRLKDEDKSKYLEIGESDRMTLLFQKP